MAVRIWCNILSEWFNLVDSALRLEMVGWHPFNLYKAAYTFTKTEVQAPEGEAISLPTVWIKPVIKVCLLLSFFLFSDKTNNKIYQFMTYNSQYFITELWIQPRFKET